MPVYARIQDGVVAELFTPPAGVPIADCFAPGLTWVDCTATPGVAVGWTYSSGAFSAPPASPAPTLAQQAAAMLAAGCQIVSTGTPALDGTYACDNATQQHIMAEMISVLTNNVFADGGSTVAWADIAGASHTFTVAQFKAFSTAIAAFVATNLRIAASNTGTLPAQPITIA